MRRILVSRSVLQSGQLGLQGFAPFGLEFRLWRLVLLIESERNKIESLRTHQLAHLADLFLEFLNPLFSLRRCPQELDLAWSCDADWKLEVSCISATLPGDLQRSRPLSSM